ncbi:MAG: ERCC4 domain-containing protein [Armatimonadota bacterium]
MTSSPPFKPVVVIDTREQRPYGFTDRVAGSVRRALPAGDYSVEGFETVVAIERKTLDDFVGTVIHARERFSRELAQLGAYRFAWILVEGSLDDLLRGHYQSRAHPTSLLGLTMAIMVEYRIPVLFAHDRPCARTLTEALLVSVAIRLQRENGESV